MCVMNMQCIGKWELSSHLFIHDMKAQIFLYYHSLYALILLLPLENRTVFCEIELSLYI